MTPTCTVVRLHLLTGLPEQRSAAHIVQELLPDLVSAWTDQCVLAQAAQLCNTRTMHDDDDG